MTAPNIEARHQQVAGRFIAAIEDFEKGAYSSRGLAKRAEELTSPEELLLVNDELLNHTFWVMRHLVHQPACWAPSNGELMYLYRCLKGEEQFQQDVADSFRLK
ncbi:MAG: hypothetical protein GYB66_00630 [Chloroflexi bacterium]|nr:hypothetical protein [Chloroflexota bacterium]